jgi:3-deoxy-7-phosphoheptulonate synthase
VRAIPVVKRLSHLPVIVDPSHASGMSWMVEPLSLAATAAGADGLMIEVHNDPPNAKCDGQQSLTPESFGNLMKKLAPLAKMLGKEIEPAGEIC